MKIGRARTLQPKVKSVYVQVKGTEADKDGKKSASFTVPDQSWRKVFAIVKKAVEMAP